MKMRSLIVAGFVAATSFGAYAGEFDSSSSAQSFSGPGKTRAEVKAETLRALAAGEVSFGDVGYPNATRPAVATTPGRSRAEVKAETRQALAAGEITFGDSAYPRPAVAAATGVTRAEVKGELLRAIAAHELHFSDTAYPDSGIYTTPRAKVRKPVEPQTAMVAGAPAS